LLFYKKAHLFKDGLFLCKPKKAFNLIEIIFVLILLSIILTFSIPKKQLSKIHLAKQQIITHLKYTRYIAMLDNKYHYNDNLWYKKLWNLKFLKCNKNIGGIYYVIYSNTINPNRWNISKEETLKDPLTNNYIYSTSKCQQDNLYDKSKYVLLSNYYSINDIRISCNQTSSLGQIYFDNNGSAYSYIDNDYGKINKYKIKENCTLILKDIYNKEVNITIEGNTGYIY